MLVNDTDLELLENYLDNELSSSEHEELRKRLSSEPALTAAMEELQSQREMRRLFFASVEPEDKSIVRLMNAVKRDVTREIATGERNQSLRWIGSLAACLLIGFMMGRGTRSQTDTTVSIPGPSMKPIVVTGPGAGTVSPNEPRLVFDGPHLRPRDFNITQINPNVIRPQLVNYQVRLVDPAGNVFRQFNSKDEFDKFINEQMGGGIQPVIGR